MSESQEDVSGLCRDTGVHSLPHVRAPKCRTGRVLARPGAGGMIKLPSPPRLVAHRVPASACRLLFSYQYYTLPRARGRAYLSLSRTVSLPRPVYTGLLHARRLLAPLGFSTFSGFLNSGSAFSSRNLCVSGHISENIPSAARARRLAIRTPTGPVPTVSAARGAHISPLAARACIYLASTCRSSLNDS